MSKRLDTGIIEQILDLARFAPSGDNAQPWRFEIVNNAHVIIHACDTRQECVYDLRGHASHIAVGALIETIVIAASIFGLRVNFENHSTIREDTFSFDVFFENDESMTRDSLASFIRGRVTQRRALSTAKLSSEQANLLEASLSSGFSIQFRYSFWERLRIAKLLYKSAYIRLTTREAFETHRKAIEWHATVSEDRIPDHAIGVDPLLLRSMRWAMKSWSRIKFINRFLGGTIFPRIELDFLPALCCAGHFFIVANELPKTVGDFIASGRALQRFWLTATELGLLVQPEMTLLIFTEYDRTGVQFTTCKRALARASSVRSDLEEILGSDICARTVFMGRIGRGSRPVSRSVRLPLSKLIIK